MRWFLKVLEPGGRCSPGLFGVWERQRYWGLRQIRGTDLNRFPGSG